MTKQEHKYAQVLRWIADGERIQHKHCRGWMGCDNQRLLVLISSGAADNPASYRLAPRTIRVNGVEVPAPESVAPEKGITYYVPDPSADAFCYKATWEDQSLDNNWLSRGLVYLNKEDAIARAKAMLLTQE